MPSVSSCGALRGRGRTAVLLGLAGLLLMLAACTVAEAEPDVVAAQSSSTTAASSETTAPPTTAAPTTTTTTTLVAVAPADPQPDPPPPSPGQEPPEGERGVAVAAAGGMPYAAAPGAEPIGVAWEGLVFGVEEREGEWLGMRDQCDERIWAHADGLAFTPAAPPGEPGSMDFSEAVLVIDPGHGGPNVGAVGPSGLREPVVNLDIARRIRDLLASAHTIDWDTGTVYHGDQVPAAAAVWVTRTEGPPGADIDAGLTYRATLATSAGAHAFVSVHNNADPDGPFDGPGSEVFFQIADEQSRRLAGIMIEEFRRSFLSFDAAWVGDTDAGAKYRLRSDGESDYYGVLRESGVPAVIAEGAFISNPDEERLLATGAFRQAYAEAVYRALVRFITTTDPGSGYTEPYERTTPAGSGAPAQDCRIPQQP